MTEADVALTKSLEELVQRRVASDAAFAENLLREGIDAMLAGDVDTGKAILRNYSRRRSASKSSEKRPIRRPRA